MAAPLRTSNPALNEKAFRGEVALGGETMTLQGMVNKTGFLLLCVVVTAAWTWGLAHSETPEAAMPWMIGGVVGGFVTALVTIFKRSWAPITAPLYALLEGLALGGISAFFERSYHGIAAEAVGLTFAVLFVMLIAYKTGVIRATERFKLGVIAATGGIAVFYLVAMVLNLFHVNVGILYSGSPWAIGFSVFVVIIAALNLVLDFDMIETGVRIGAPKYMEWYGAFGLMVTLIWLYLEILRLLANSRRR
ncbi:MAG TPA: Bax inhibitor-1/YccA family protein [Candidatus Saccharimonadales bacterium]|nr:Bax inhibitor-1/YccA family protein [Candidatus Saccharimonadales bacterium]